MNQSSNLDKASHFVEGLGKGGLIAPNVIVHGSIATGREPTSVTDIDLIVYLDEGNTSDTTNKLSRRTEALRIIKDTYAKTNLQELGTLNSCKLPLSLLVIPGCESRWDIVKTIKKYEFFNMLFNKKGSSYRVISGKLELFKPDQKLQHCIRLMNSEYGIWNEYADLVKHAQIVRQWFCQGTFDVESKVFESFKGLCRTWSGLLAGYDQVDGYNYMVAELRSFGLLESKSTEFIQRKLYNDCEDMPVRTLIELSEISSLYALNKLMQHLPEPNLHVQNMITEFKASVQSDNSIELI